MGGTVYTEEASTLASLDGPPRQRSAPFTLGHTSNGSGDVLHARCDGPSSGGILMDTTLAAVRLSSTRRSPFPIPLDLLAIALIGGRNGPVDRDADAAGYDWLTVSEQGCSKSWICRALSSPSNPMRGWQDAPIAPDGSPALLGPRRCPSDRRTCSAFAAVATPKQTSRAQQIPAEARGTPA